MMIYRKGVGRVGRGVMLLAACAVLGAMACGCSILKPHRSEWRDAVVDAEGRVIVMWLTYDGKEEPASWQDEYWGNCDYGIFTDWYSPDQRFYLFDNRAKKYFGTSDFSKFLAALDAMPEGIKMVWIGTCGGGRGVPEDVSAQVKAVMEKGHREDMSWDYPAAFICTCESTNIRFPDLTTGEEKEK